MFASISRFFGKIISAFQADVPDDQTEGAEPDLPQGAALDNPHLIAILTAAAIAATGRQVRIHRITFLNSNTVSGWAEMGRTSIHQSHNLRRNPN